jgi:hypothetical protein
MSNTLKISLTFFFIFLIYFPTKSNHINKEQSICIEESIIEFEIVKFFIEEDEQDPTFTTYSMEFKAKRNTIWLPCEYDMTFWTHKENKWSLFSGQGCSWSSESGLPPLEKIETKLRPSENRKAGRILAQKIKEKGYSKAAENMLSMVNSTKKGGCGINIFQ